MDCINFKWSIEQAHTCAELDELVTRMLQQFDATYFQLLYPGVSWQELGEILEAECEADERMPSLAYWLDLVQQRYAELLSAP